MRDLLTLLPLVEAQVFAAQRRLALCRAVERRIAGQIGELREGRRSQPRGEDLARRVGADLKWHLWIDQRLTELATEQARLRGETLVAEAQLRHVFGREVGLRHVLDTKRREIATLQKRREDYAS